MLERKSFMKRLWVISLLFGFGPLAIRIGANTTGTIMLVPDDHPGSYPVLRIEGERIVRRVDVAIANLDASAPAPVLRAGSDGAEKTFNLDPQPRLRDVYKRIHVPVTSHEIQLTLATGEN